MRDTMQPSQIDVLVDGYNKNRDPGEIALELGISRAAVTSAFYRLRRGNTLGHDGLEEKLPPLPPPALARFEQALAKALAALAETAATLSALGGDDDARIQSAARELAQARANISDCRAEVRLRVALGK